MKSKERGIETRVLFVALAPVIATAVALALYFTLLRYNDVEAALRQRGFAMTRQLVAAAQYGLFSGNVVELNRLVEVLSHEPDVSAITIYDQQHMPLAASGTPRASPPPSNLSDGWSGGSKNGEVLSFHSKVFASPLSLDDPYSAKPPASIPDLLLGSATIELSRNDLVARKREILLFTVGAALLILLIVGLIARRLGRDISEPVLALESAVNRIREGLLDARVQPHPAGTLRTLEDGINAMATALEQARKRSSEALFSSEEKLQQQSDFANALLEAQSNAGVCMTIVENGRVVFANQAALDFGGLKKEDLAHLEPSDMLAQKDIGKFEAQYLNILHGKLQASVIEVRIITRQGTERWAEITSLGLDRGGTRQVVLLGIDITQRKRDAEQLQVAHKILQAQKEEAERANAAKSRFLASASHDLRQPLHALSLFSGQLQECVTTRAQSRLAYQMDAAIGNMSELLESLLDISKIDLATLRPDIRPIELGPLLEHIATTHRHAAESKQLRLGVARTSLRISSDPHHLFRIISNLVSNAVRYTEQGTVLIGARRAGENVRIEVWDTGIGIAEQHIPSLFHEFYQVANPERDARKGLGLGLAIVDRLANLLGHKIHVRSMPGVGSAFTVLVPRAKLEDGTPSSFALGKPNASILLATDDESQQNELAVLLYRWGYAVSPCRTDKIAQALAAALPDLIISEQSCLSCLNQGPNTLADNGMPVICIMDESALPDTQNPLCPCSPLAMPVKPAKLRALILHLLSQKD